MATMDDLADRHLTVPRLRLAPVALAAGLFPAWAFLRALSLSIHFSATDEALYATRVGHQLGLVAAGVGVALITLAIAVRWLAPSPTSPVLTTGVVIVVAGLLGVMGAAWVHADRAMHPFGPELEALAAFIPPPGATEQRDRRLASDHPEVTRHWRVPLSTEEVCRQAVLQVESWADPSTVTNVLPAHPGSCYFRGRRDGHTIELIVSEPFRAPFDSASLSLTIIRDELADQPASSSSRRS